MRKLENVLKSVKSGLLSGVFVSAVGILGVSNQAQAGLTYEPLGTTTLTVTNAAEEIKMVVTFSNNTADLWPTISNIGMYQPSDISYTLTTKDGVTTGTDCTIYIADNYKNAGTYIDYILIETDSSADIKLSTTDLSFYSGTGLENLYLTDSSLTGWNTNGFQATISHIGSSYYYLDNVSIDNNAPTVPTPGAFALTALGGVIASRRRALKS